LTRRLILFYFAMVDFQEYYTKLIEVEKKMDLEIYSIGSHADNKSNRFYEGFRESVM